VKRCARGSFRRVVRPEATTTDRTDQTRVRLVALVGLAVSCLFLWLAFRNLSFSLIRDALSRGRLWPWVPLAMMAYLAGHGVRGMRLRALVSPETDLPLGTATSIVVLGYAVNNILPARMGEVARAALLSDRMGTPFTQSLTVTVLERILDGWTTLFLLIVGIALIPQVDYSLLRTAYVAALLFAVATMAMLLMAVFPSAIASLASRIAGAVSVGWQEPVYRRCLYVSTSLSYLRRPAHTLKLGVLSLMVWTLETFMFVLVLPVFDLTARFDWSLLALGITNLGTVVPSTPGFIGPYHYFCMETLVLLGVPKLTASAYAITVHAVFYVPITLWGVAVLMRYGIELGRLTAAATDARKPAAATIVNGVSMVVLGSRKVSEATSRPGPFLLALTEALAPLPAADAGGAHPREMTERVASFVMGQLSALPAGLRLMLRVGLLGFRFLVRLRYVRGFCDLPLSKQRAVVSAWAYGPYEVTRKLFRALRSLTLFRYYEELEDHGEAAKAPGLLQVIR